MMVAVGAPVLPTLVLLYLLVAALPASLPNLACTPSSCHFDRVQIVFSAVQGASASSYILQRSDEPSFSVPLNLTAQPKPSSNGATLTATDATAWTDAPPQPPQPQAVALAPAAATNTSTARGRRLQQSGGLPQGKLVPFYRVLLPASSNATLSSVPNQPVDGTSGGRTGQQGRPLRLVPTVMGQATAASGMFAHVSTERT